MAVLDMLCEQITRLIADNSADADSWAAVDEWHDRLSVALNNAFLPVEQRLRESEPAPKPVTTTTIGRAVGDRRET